jgi:hypothetical protein
VYKELALEKVPVPELVQRKELATADADADNDIWEVLLHTVVSCEP